MTTGTGEQAYSQLVLATGARRQRGSRLADESDAEVAYLRTIDDSDRLAAPSPRDAGW